VSTRDHALEVFSEIHDLISCHDNELRWSGEVYDRVRKCFDLLFKYKWGEVPPETAYHSEVNVENWKWRDGVKEQYESILQEVKEELRLACKSYHTVPQRPLDYGTYYAFMETYRMCMDATDMDVIPTIAEEKYLFLGSQVNVSTAKTLAEGKRSDLLRELHVLCV
jgi:hypothetical protein